MRFHYTAAELTEFKLSSDFLLHFYLGILLLQHLSVI